jgi:hypothetical protein
VAASGGGPESRSAAGDPGIVHMQTPAVQGSKTTQDRRRIPFGRPALIKRMDDVLSLDGDNGQGPSLSDLAATPRPDTMPVARPVASAASSTAASTGSNLFADRRIPSARREPEGAEADASPQDRIPNRHAGPSHGRSPNHNRRRKPGRLEGRRTVIIYAAVAVLVAAVVAAFVATRQPSSSPTTPADSATTQHRHDRTDRSHDGSVLPGGLNPSATSSPIAAITPPAAGGPSAAGPAPSGPQPIGWWDLNDASGMTAADSVYYHNGVAENISWIGGAAGFNGADSQIEVPETVVDTGQNSSFTVAAWVDLTSDSAFATAVSQDTTVDSGFYLEYDQTDNAWAFSRHSSNTVSSPVDRATSSGPPALNTWTALIGVFDAGTDQLQIYVNGQPQGVASDPTPFASTGDLVFGRSVTDGVDNAYFPGLIGDVQVFNQALTQPEAESLSGY